MMGRRRVSSDVTLVTSERILHKTEDARDAGASPVSQRDAASQSAVDILPPQVVGEDVAAVPAHQANIIIIDDRYPAREEGLENTIEITMAEAEEAKALIEGEMSPNTSVESTDQ
ncbi:uncharacterized protein A4U43_C04F22110 [Asparagus officinalis]|uniref:Uncharacterized protein n=1 Tax=Asparagus officinalis TaxID=4686 RepID=A0A5P1F3F2_ASPOF|nr:uncharacterized protein A4U43_C04F22110 [Asparagus officinalis]